MHRWLYWSWDQNSIIIFTLALSSDLIIIYSWLCNHSVYMSRERTYLSVDVNLDLLEYARIYEGFLVESKHRQILYQSNNPHRLNVTILGNCNSAGPLIDQLENLFTLIYGLAIYQWEKAQIHEVHKAQNWRTLWKKKKNNRLTSTFYKVWSLWTTNLIDRRVHFLSIYEVFIIHCENVSEAWR